MKYLRISWAKGWGLGEEAMIILRPPLLLPHPFLQQASGKIFKDDVNCFSSTSDICFIVPNCVVGGSSIVNSQQRVAIIGSPPLLDGNWRMQGTRKQSRATEIGPSFFFMMYISFAAKIHNNHGCKTTISWF
jgi:hypothetical protein